MPHGFFLARFANKEDCELALFRGLWSIAKHYLLLKEWQPNFDSAHGLMTLAMIWVRISELSVEYFDTSFLMRLGAKIGHPIKIDTAIIQVFRGKYAQICVEVDLANRY